MVAGDLYSELNVRKLGLQAYESTWQAMSSFTDNRGPATTDELWVLQHDAVYTQGQAGKAEHVLAPGDIPVVQSDRGGQVTYHGPGQLIVYPLINLKRRKIGVRDMVTLLEQVTIDLLAKFGVQAYAKSDAPGVYVDLQEKKAKRREEAKKGGEAKIASLGLRIRRGCCFHGLSININMDLAPFKQINPCGYQGLNMTQLKELPVNQPIDYAVIEDFVIDLIAHKLGVSTTDRGNILPTKLS